MGYKTAVKCCNQVRTGSVPAALLQCCNMDLCNHPLILSSFSSSFSSFSSSFSSFSSLMLLLSCSFSPAPSLLLLFLLLLFLLLLFLLLLLHLLLRFHPVAYIVQIITFIPTFDDDSQHLICSIHSLSFSLLFHF